MSAPQAILALKAAIRARLLATPDVTALTGQAIHDAPPRETHPPYLLLGDAFARENGGVEMEAHLVDLELQVVTRERGTREALDLAHRIEIALGTAPLMPSGYQASLLLIREVLTRHDPKASLSRIILRLRASLHAIDQA